MYTVTRITDQKRRKGRVSVHLDEEFWTGMSKLCQIELSLGEGDELTEERKREVELQVALTDALTYCLEVVAARAVSRHMLADKLARREYSEAVIEATLSRCEELCLLNDEMFADAYATGRKALGQGARRVAQALRDKGIDRELAEEVIARVFPQQDEDEHAQSTLRARYHLGLSASQRSSALAFLIRRGFSFDAAQRAVAEALLDEDAAETANAVEAEALLRGKYPDLNPKNPRDTRRATAFLLRRGVAPQIAREAIAALRND